MSFRETVRQDVSSVFLNLDEFAETRTVKYDGDVFTDIPLVISEHREESREIPSDRDHAQGLYQVFARVHAALKDLGGRVPEQGMSIRITTKEGGTFFQKYYVQRSKCEMGLVIMELRAVDE